MTRHHALLLALGSSLLATGLLSQSGCSKPAVDPASSAPAASAPASADPAGWRGPETQTLDQMLERTRARFERMDLDHDGKVTQAEMDEARAQRDSQGGGGGPGGGMMSRADANGDGAVTLDEMQSQARDRFARLDADKDGKVTRDEMQAGRRPPQ